MKTYLMYALFVVGFTVAITVDRDELEFWGVVLVNTPIFVWAFWVAQEVCKEEKK